MKIEARLKSRAHELGFDLVGIAELGPVDTAGRFDSWIAAGYSGDMAYLARGAEKRRDSSLPFSGARSAIVVGMNYGGAAPAGPVARYARGDDYHELMTGRLQSLHRWIESELGREVRGKAYVDTGPILERDLARKAGLGWIGKNTMLVNPKIGSFFFIGALLLDLALDSDAPFEADRCGTCTRCIEACPTDAFVDVRVMDATRCISYLTIESRGEVPDDLKAGIGENLYGCDICQDVCPWNGRFATDAKESAFSSRDWLSALDATALAREILSMDDDTFTRQLKGSPMKRAKLSGLRRNARVVLANVGEPEEAAV